MLSQPSSFRLSCIWLVRIPLCSSVYELSCMWYCWVTLMMNYPWTTKSAWSMAWSVRQCDWSDVLMTNFTPWVRYVVNHLVWIHSCTYQVSLLSLTVEAPPMAWTILLHLDWYLLITLVTHAEDFLLIFTLCVITVWSLLSSLLFRGNGVIGSLLTLTTSTSTVESVHSPSSAVAWFPADTPVIGTSVDLV